MLLQTADYSNNIPADDIPTPAGMILTYTPLYELCFAAVL